ncbi:uncharacterized protein LOC126266296 [Aethina tumida]|uniref:uncharacterized protein LOC126266296 n=1 Tax=Aethina tumida TaxID=116153 RepID=UPI002148DE07|nr:uncharacterized protein LOC126266296 [Aethina tumida]
MALFNYYLEKLDLFKTLTLGEVHKAQYEINQIYCRKIFNDISELIYSFEPLVHRMNESDLNNIIVRKMGDYIEKTVSESFHDKLKERFDTESKERVQIQKKFILKLIDVFTNSSFLVQDGGAASQMNADEWRCSKDTGQKKQNIL